MTKHKHADIMMEYAQVAQESETPWEEFELWDSGAKIWRELVCSPSFREMHLYRRKQKMSKIGEHEYPAAIAELPEFDVEYFYPDMMEHSLCRRLVYEGPPAHDNILRRGMLHHTKENAIAHTKAIILASGGKI